LGRGVKKARKSSSTRAFPGEKVTKTRRLNQLSPCFAAATAYSNDIERGDKLMPVRQQPISIFSLGLTRWKQQRRASLGDATVKGRISLRFPPPLPELHGTI
jgi:hypothetical protein